jgi:phage gp36-like protein
MGYVSDEDIRLRLGERAFVQLTDDAATGSADLDVVAEARLGAEGEVDSYLARRYRVPIDTVQHAEVTALLKTVTLNVIEYRLHARRPPVPPDIETRYRAALNWLAQVGAGEVLLPSAAELPGNPANGPVAVKGGNKAALSRDELAGL